MALLLVAVSLIRLKGAQSTSAIHMPAALFDKTAIFVDHTAVNAAFESADSIFEVHFRAEHLAMF